MSAGIKPSAIGHSKKSSLSLLDSSVQRNAEASEGVLKHPPISGRTGNAVSSDEQMKKKVDTKLLGLTPDDNLLKVFPFSKHGFTRGELREMKRKMSSETSAQKFLTFLLKGRTEREIKSKFKDHGTLLKGKYKGFNLFVQRNLDNEKVYILLPEILDEIVVADRQWKHAVASSDGRQQPYIAVQFPKVNWEKIIIAPLFDVHYGNIGHRSEKFLSYLRWIAETPNVFAVIGGDLMENALDDGRGMTYDQNVPPEGQIGWMIKALAPIAHKILVAIPGNHEWRTYHKAGIDPLMAITRKLNIPYFDGPVFLDVLAGGHRWTSYISHGYGNSQTKGGKMNMAGKPRKFTSFVNFFISGHVHDPVVNSETCIVPDAANMRLTYPQQWTVIAPSFLRWEGTYAYRAGYPPPGSGGVIIELSLNGEYRAVLQ